MDLLDDSAVVYQIVLTKIDKISNVEAIATDIENRLKKRVAAYPSVIASSSEKNLGIKEIQAEITSLLNE